MSIKMRLKGFCCLFLFLSLVSCKKDKIDANKPAPTNNRTELTKDSIFLYAKEVYLWNTALPTYSVFNPRSFTQYRNDFDNYEDELLKITRYTSYENWYSSRGDLYDEPKYSYIDDTEANGIVAGTGKKSYVDLDGYGNDVGLGLAYVGVNNNYTIYVKYVSPGSPAAAQKIKRGSVVSKVNNRSYGSNFNTEIDLLSAAMEGNSVTLDLVLPSTQQPRQVVLYKNRYKSSPIFKDTVYTRGTDNIGYLAYARFSEITDSEPALNAAFQRFASKNVNKLIVDLRYNGGGYVSSAAKLINLILPGRFNNQLLFTEKYNETMRTGKATLLKNQFYTENGVKKSYFGRYEDITYKADKQASGYLQNIDKVVFIVSSSTASASELVINSLKPYIDVKLIGEKTYGKPVGFFPVRIDKYDIYYSMFESVNSRNEGAYYSGMAVDQAIDDMPYNKDLGDPAESNTDLAIRYLQTGSFSSSGNQTLALSKTSIGLKAIKNANVLKQEGFKGMIEHPRNIFK